MFSWNDAPAVPFGAGPGNADRDERLDPPRWRLPWPRRSSLLRAIAVAALLCMAAAVLLVDGSPPPAKVAVAPPKPAATPSRPPVAPAGTVGLPLRLRDSGFVTVLRPGQHVDVLAGGPTGGPATTLAANVLVLRAAAGGEAPEDGALIYLAVTPEQAARVAGIATETPITVTVRSP